MTLREKALVPPLVPRLPCWPVVIAFSEIGVSTKNRTPRWVGPCGPALASTAQQALAPAEVLKSGRVDLEF